jgi:multiple sugar transport system permease protein
MASGAGSRERFLLLPAAAFAAVVVVLPVLRVVVLSLSHVELEGELNTRWAGLASYVRLWQDTHWWTALRNTLVFTTTSVLLETVLGVAFALVLHRSFRGRGLLRAVVLLPWALPTAVMALSWAWIFNDSFGVANDLLQRAGLVDSPLAWLGEPALAMAALVIAEVWKTTPFVALVVLAGLQGIPETLIEAARVDGLTAWQRFRHVVLPLLLPSVLVAVLFRAVQAYGAFDIVYVMTGGGPGGSTETVSLYAFQNFFRYLDFGYGSALATQSALLAVLAAAALLALARTRQPPDAASKAKERG